MAKKWVAPRNGGYSAVVPDQSIKSEDEVPYQKPPPPPGPGAASPLPEVPHHSVKKINDKP